MTAIRIRVGALLTDGERVLLVRHEKGGRAYYLLPGGGIEAGEIAPEALAREVREETGLQIEVGPLLAITETIFPGGSRHILHLVFLASSWKGELSRGPEDERVQGTGWMNIKDWYDVPFVPDIREYLVELIRCGLNLPARHVRADWIEL